MDRETAIDPHGNTTTTRTFSASTISNKSQVDGLFANKANAIDVYSRSQVDGLIPSMLYGVMQFYDDDTGTRRGVISQPTTCNFALFRRINPTGTPIMMTMTQEAGVVVYTT